MDHESPVSADLALVALRLSAPRSRPPPARAAAGRAGSFNSGKNPRILDRRGMIQALSKCWVSLAQPEEFMPRWTGCPVP